MVKLHLQFQFTHKLLVCVHCSQVTNTHFTMCQRYRNGERLLRCGGWIVSSWLVVVDANLFIKPFPLYLISVAFFNKFITGFPQLLAFLDYFLLFFSVFGTQSINDSWFEVSGKPVFIF